MDGHVSCVGSDHAKMALPSQGYPRDQPRCETRMSECLGTTATSGEVKLELSLLDIEPSLTRRNADIKNLGLELCETKHCQCRHLDGTDFQKPYGFLVTAEIAPRFPTHGYRQKRPASLADDAAMLNAVSAGISRITAKNTGKFRESLTRDNERARFRGSFMDL